MTPRLRDIVGRGRRRTGIAVALLLVPHLFLAFQAFRTGHVGAGGMETARLVVWIGSLYLVYLGFKLIRWIVLLYASIVVVYAIATLIQNGSQAGAPAIILGVAFVGSLTAGLVLLLFDPAIRAFLNYQLGGTVPEPELDGSGEVSNER